MKCVHVMGVEESLAAATGRNPPILFVVFWIVASPLTGGVREAVISRVSNARRDITAVGV